MIYFTKNKMRGKIRMEFSIFKRNKIIGAPSLAILIYIIFTLFIFPFFTWFTKSHLPLSIHTIWQYIAYTLQHFPINKKQENDVQFIAILLMLYFVFLLIFPYIKLVVTPEKIFYRLFKIPIITLIKREHVEYAQIAKITLDLSKTRKFLFKNQIPKQPELYFFPLRNLQNVLDLKLFNQEQQQDFLTLLKQFYNFKSEPVEIQLTLKELQKLTSQQYQTNISPRIAYILISCIPIGAIGMYLTANSPFFFINNYPNVLLLTTIFIPLLIFSFIWIYQDIKTLAFFGALLSSFIVTIASYFFLFPVLHGYYTQKFGKSIEFKAKLIEINPREQVWQPLNGKDKFYISKKHPYYNNQLELNQGYNFPAHYHWHTYTINEKVFLTLLPIQNKKDR